jgi:prephenate dehydrogenase
VAEAQLVVVCTPVDLVADYVVQAAAACPKNAVITDAGSTKVAIVSAVDTVLAGRREGPRFLGSHPIAGDHRTGTEYARASLFEGRTVVVTPTDATPAGTLEQITHFWESLGARVTAMSAAEHDAALAATSHLPHLVAAALAAATPRELLPLTAGGWRDTTRVAGGDPQLWRPIFATNRPQVLSAIEQFEASLSALRNALETKDDGQFEQLLLDAKRTRDALGD